MQRTFDTLPDAETFLPKATRVAQHYGFTPFSQIANAAHKRTAARIPNLVEYRKALDPHAGEFISAVKGCVEHNALRADSPLTFYYTNLDTARAAKPKQIQFGLHVLGVPHSVAEAIILRAALAILEDIGVADACVHVNSLGDKDTLARLSRDLTAFFRKHMNELSPAVQQAIKRDALFGLQEVATRKEDVAAHAPRPMEYLNENGRRHLWEVLEYLESFGTPYEIDDGLVGHRDCYTQTLFEIRNGHDENEDLVLARGGRYDELPRRLFRMQMPAVGLVFTCQPRRPKSVRVPTPRATKPKVYFVHLGFEAKIKSLGVVEELRRARIPLHQSLSSETLSPQLRHAESLGVPYTLIMGHKEALEDSVIVRNMHTRAQETVPTATLPTHLKSLLARRA